MTTTIASGALDVSAYRDAAVLQKELEHIFSKGWHYVGTTHALRKPGDRLVATAGRTPVVVTRDAQGRLHAHVNACRHRWHPVAVASGNASTLSCAYHRWTYALDGTLLNAPDARFDPAFDKARHGLVKLRVDTVGAWVFVGLEPQGPALSELLSDLSEVVQQIVDRTAPYEYVERTEFEVAANWKLFGENTTECYHCAGLHSQTISACINTRRDQYRLSLHENAWSQFGPPIEQLEELGGRDVGLQFVMMFPATFIGVDDVVAFAGAARPVSSGKTLITFDLLRNPAISDAAFQRRAEMYTRTMNEDLRAVESVQQVLDQGVNFAAAPMHAAEAQLLAFVARYRQAMSRC